MRTATRTGLVSDFRFEEAIEVMKSRDDGDAVMPENLQGGVLLDQTYVAAPRYLNAYLFEPDSHFRRELSEIDGIVGYEEAPWTWDREQNSQLRRLRRSVAYTRSATTLAVKVTEEQSYLKADGKNFSVLVRVDTPVVPCSDCFEVHLLYKIMPGPPLLTSDESAKLVISWNRNFFQRSAIRGMIERSARQGLRESYERFSDLLAQEIKPIGKAEIGLQKDQHLAPLRHDHRSDWELAIAYLCNFTVLCFVFMALLFLLHIMLSGPHAVQGIEFSGVDLPDTFGELITSGILVLLAEHVYRMLSRFMRAKIRRGILIIRIFTAGYVNQLVFQE